MVNQMFFIPYHQTALAFHTDSNLTPLYGCTHKDVHFYWLHTKMIGILRQLKFTSTETEISQTGLQWDMLVWWVRNSNHANGHSVKIVIRY